MKRAHVVALTASLVVAAGAGTADGATPEHRTAGLEAEHPGSIPHVVLRGPRPVPMPELRRSGPEPVPMPHVQSSPGPDVWRRQPLPPPRAEVLPDELEGTTATTLP